MKRTIRLTESDLHRVVKESVKRILRENTMKLNEYGDTPKGQYMLGRLQARKGNKTWAPSWVASEERDNAADKAEKQGKSYNITHNNMLRAYRDGINGVQWDESLNRVVKESVKESVRRILKEDNDPLGWNYGGGYQVCIFPTRNGGMKASVIEIGSPVTEDALQVCYTGTLEDCEARAERWNAKNYWNR